jgi:hypothetical protein
MMKQVAKKLRKRLRLRRLLAVSLVVISTIIAVTIYIRGFSVPLYRRTDGTDLFNKKHEQIAKKRYQTALESYRKSADPQGGLIKLEAELSEIVKSWPATLTGVKSNQMRVAVSRHPLSVGKLNAASSKVLHEFLEEAIARPRLYFSIPASYTSTSIVAAAISSLRSNDKEGEAWSVCRCVRWQTRDIKPIAKICEELWLELSLPKKFWFSISTPAPSYNENIFVAAIKNPNVIIRILKYRINPYRSKNVRKLAGALYLGGAHGLAESVKGELLKVDFMRAVKLEDRWSKLSGKKYPKYNFPNWGANDDNGQIKKP